MLWCVVYAETECESPAGQTNNMSLHPGPDHPPTTLNADELVATTTGQPQRPQGYLGSGVMWQECVCVFGVTWGYSSGFKRKKKKWVWSRRGWGWRCAVALFVQALTCSCYMVTLRCFSFNRNDIFVLLLF